MHEGLPVDYVMVPVPEDLAPKVLRYISWRDSPLIEKLGTADGDDEPASGGAPTAEADRGGDPITRVVARLDGQSRSLLAVVATAALERQKLTVTETAQRAGLSERELIGIVTEVNNLVAAEGGSPITVLITGMEGAGETAFSWQMRVVNMPEPVARAIADLTVARVD